MMIFTKKHNGPFLSTTAIVSALLLVVLLALSQASVAVATEETSSMSVCSSLNNKKRECRDHPECHWVIHRFATKNPDELARTVRCVDAMTDEQCSPFTDKENAKIKCRFNGCKWNREDNTCIGRLDHVNRVDNDGGDLSLEDLLKPEKNLVDRLFLMEFIGTDAAEVETAIIEAYPRYAGEGGVYVVAVCTQNMGLYVGEPACIQRNYNVHRIKLIVDANNKVNEIIFG